MSLLGIACRTVLAMAALLAMLVAAPVRGAEPIVINLIALPAAASGQVYFAQELGFFKEAGLDVRITSMTSGPAIISAVVSGAADIGFATVGPAAAARERGLPVRFIAGGGLYVASNPTSMIVGANDTTMRAAADLNGKTIAVTSLADLTYFAAKAWIDKYGGDSRTVKFVELPFPQMAPALAGHRIDAAVTTEPFLTMAKTQEREIGSVNDAIAPRFMLTGWLATDTWIKSHEDAATRFAAVMRRAAAWANGSGHESAQILGKYTKIPPDVAASMRQLRYAESLDPKLLQPPIDNAAKYGGGTAIAAADLIWTPSR